MAHLGAGYTPDHFEFYDPNAQARPEDADDIIAEIVIDRFREAARYKSSNAVYQGKSTVALLREADYAMAKRYSNDERQRLQEVFRGGPNGYYGLSAAKTTAIANWKSELVAGDPGALVGQEVDDGGSGDDCAHALASRTVTRYGRCRQKLTRKRRPRCA